MMKYTKFKDEKQTVTVLQRDVEGHCIETCGKLYVIFYYNDDESKNLVIADSSEFHLTYYESI